MTSLVEAFLSCAVLTNGYTAAARQSFTRVVRLIFPRPQIQYSLEIRIGAGFVDLSPSDHYVSLRDRFLYSREKIRGSWKQWYLKALPVP